jgi:hypothetical protein
VPVAAAAPEPEVILLPDADRRAPWPAILALVGAVLFLIGLTGTAIWS